MILRLTPPRFVGALGEDAYEFLSSFKDRLLNLGLVESRKVDFINY